MDKEIYIRDYARKKKKVIIPQFENVKRISVQILSGDEILNVVYSDCSTKRFDSCDCRTADYYDGEYNLPLNKVDEFSNFGGSSYDCSGLFDEYDND